MILEVTKHVDDDRLDKLNQYPLSQRRIRGNLTTIFKL